jgi:hypothetical protein
MVRSKLLFSLVFLLILSASFSACLSNYSYSFTARVLDAKLRPVPNASVTITYDRGFAAGDQYFTSEPKLTSWDGTIQFFIDNPGQAVNRDFDCKITLEARVFGGSKNKTIIEGGRHGSLVDVVLADAYPLRINVRDQRFNPLGGAIVGLNNETLNVGSSGSILLHAKAGSIPYFVNFKEASENGIIDLNDDTIFDITIPAHSIKIDVSDEFGNPLSSSLTILNSTKTISDGSFSSSLIYGENVPYEIRYLNAKKSGIIYPSEKNEIRVVFDKTSPKFGKIEIDPKSTSLIRLLIPVSDDGVYSSGIDSKSLTVRYKLDGESSFRNAVTYVSTRGIYASEIMNVSEGKIVNFVASVKDGEGNLASVDGRLQIPISAPVTTPDQAVQEQGTPLLYIVIGVIALFLVAFLAFRIIFPPKISG